MAHSNPIVNEIYFEWYIYAELNSCLLTMVTLFIPLHKLPHTIILNSSFIECSKTRPFSYMLFKIDTNVYLYSN